MKTLKRTIYAGILMAAIVSITACSQGKKSEKAESDEHENSGMMEEGHDEGEAHEHNEGEDHQGGHDEMAMETGDNKTWTPNGNGVDLLKSDFHFITGSAENIKPEVKEADGSQVLALTADGTPTAFVFHNQYGNVGMIATLKKLDFNGTIKVIHHAKDLSNYEFVSINGANMKLGRVVNGTEKVFDESQFEAGAGEWMPLKVTAAGTHYKGYIGDKNITHGHGDEMDNGFVGIMLEGTGKIQIKSIETAVLEDE